jgi:hypothetical protein
MARKRATLDEIVATFSKHLSRSYPAPADFSRNFDILLWGKRDRSDAAGYTLTLEKNIVYLDGLIEESLAFVERLLAPGADFDGNRIAAILAEMEKRARESTNPRPHRALASREEPPFRPHAEGPAAGGAR